MTKEILFADENREKMFSGMKKVSDAVSSTLGPRGKLACIENKFGVPTITKDGVTVAKSIFLKDSFENLGASLIKDIASKTCDSVGDGTTTSTILGYALAKEGLKAMASGVSSVDLKHGIDEAIKQAIDLIESKAKPIENVEDIYNVAKVSSNNDETIGNLISSAFEKVGKDGLITVSESSTNESTLTFKEGMNIDRGYISPYFVNTEKGECELKDAYILVTEETISSASQIVNLLTQVAQTGKPLLIIAEDVVGEALPVLILNNSKGSIRVDVIKAPSFGENRTNILADICALTGATPISEKLGLTLKDTTIDHLGIADKVVSTKNETLIVGGHGNTEDITAIISQIESQLKVETSDTAKEKLKERLAKLTGGVCVLSVSADTEVQMKELKDRIEDTLSSVRASLKGGVVLGGGVTLLEVGNSIKVPTELNEDEKIGFNIVKKALEYPIKKLSENAGMSPDIVISELKTRGNGKSGYNMLTREWDDNLISKVVDPTLVEVSALKNANSIVGLILNTEVGIVDSKEDKESDR